MTRRIRNVRSWMAIAVVVVGSLAMVAAMPGASAQVNNPDDAIPYPGPFDDAEPVADEAAGDEAPAVEAAAGDEVLSETVTAGDSDSEYDPDRSIDYLGDDAGSWFERPNPVASTDPGAGGGAGGGLAVTGPAVEPIVGISAGLLALGGSALVGSRRRLRDFF